MKKLIIMLIGIVAISLTSQAQQNTVFANLTPPMVKVVSYVYEATPELNKTIVTTSNKHYAEVLLANEYGLIQSVSVYKGKFTFTFNNKVLEGQIQSKLKSADVNKVAKKNLNISTHIVRHLS